MGSHRDVIITFAKSADRIDRIAYAEVRPVPPAYVKCEAVIYCGPGHQSKAECDRKGPHAGTEDDPHTALHPARRVQLKWEGDEGMTDFFDDSPL